MRPFLIIFSLLILTIGTSFIYTEWPEGSRIYRVNVGDDSYDGNCNGRHCSLREALIASNTDGRPSEIRFINRSGQDEFIVNLSSQLPTVTEGELLLDGLTGNSSSNFQVILIGGSNSTSGLTFELGQITIQNIEFRDFSETAIRVNSETNDISQLVIGNENNPILISNCGNGLLFEGSGSISATVVGNRIKDCSQDAIRITNQSNAIDITSNIFRNCLNGIRSTVNSDGIIIKKNSFSCSSNKGISLENDPNQLSAPEILTLSNQVVKGTSSPNSLVEIYAVTNEECIQSSCEGGDLIGVTPADELGNWRFKIPNNYNVVEGLNLTAMATAGNSSSEFSPCLEFMCDANFRVDSRYAKDLSDLEQLDIEEITSSGQGMIIEDIEEIIKNPNMDYFFIKGDMSSADDVNIKNVSGFRNQKKHIIGIYEDDSGQNKVIEDKGCEQSYARFPIITRVGFIHCENWIIHGIAFDKGQEYGKSNSLIFSGCSNNNIVNNCLFQNQRHSAVRVINSNNNLIQNNLFRNSALKEEDFCDITDGNLGVFIAAYNPKTDAGYYKEKNVYIFDSQGNVRCDEIGESRGNIVCNNYFMDLNDGIALHYESRVKGKNCDSYGDCYNLNSWTGDVPGTIIDNNVIYNHHLHTGGTDYSRRLSYIENGIDIKNGSRNPEDERVIVSNNIIWGYTPFASEEINQEIINCASGGGEAVILHMNAQNITFENNYVFNSSIGIKVGTAAPSRNDGDVKNITIKNNHFSNIMQYLGEGLNDEIKETLGTPIWLGRDYLEGIYVENNQIFNSYRGIYLGKIGSSCLSQISASHNYFYQIDQPHFTAFDNNLSCLSLFRNNSLTVDQAKVEECRIGNVEEGCQFWIYYLDFINE